jgi:Uma2 family endonuclease
MSTAVPPKLMTLEEFHALPENGTDRELIRGEVRERPMTRRNRFHAASESKVSHLLRSWLDQQPKPRGEVYSGEVGCILRRDPDTTVGIDVAYFSSDTVANQTADTSMVEGAPVLAVEILSPSDKQEEIAEKVEAYLEFGVALVWIVDPHFRTVTVHRSDAAPELFNVRQQVSADPHLPGLVIAVKEL